METIRSRKITLCTKCNSFKVARIIYGILDFTDQLEKSEEQGKIIFDGCCVTGSNPKYECMECGTAYTKRPTGKDPKWTGKQAKE